MWQSCMRAVSYTHLDVYKRQVDEAENAWKGTLEKVFKTVSSENDKEAADLSLIHIWQ